MSAMKKVLHDSVIAVRKVGMGLLPDRIPMTFVGAGCFRDLCDSIAETGVRKVLVVTDAGLVELGIVGRIVDALSRLGVRSAIYDGVEPDPTFTHVADGLSMYRAERAEAVLAVGGGSPMDAAKVIAALVTNDRPLAKLEGLMKVRKPTAPLYAIPTTAGTGSEVTIAAVVSDPVTHAKKFFLDPKLVPSMTALDPELMVGLPPHITAATGMDALTHAVESYLSRTATAQTRMYAVSAVRLVFANLAKAYRDGSDLAARKSMALASYYGGLAFTRTGVGYVHAVAHQLGANYKTPHGLANAIVLPEVLEFSLEPAAARLAELADVIGVEGDGELAKARAFIKAVRALMVEVGIPTKLDTLERGDIPSLAGRALAEAHMDYPVPRYMTQDQCEAMLGRLVA